MRLGAILVGGMAMGSAFAAGPKVECRIFVLKDCPIANQFAPEIGRLAKQYSARGMKLVILVKLRFRTRIASARRC